jgi:hypothetical protein
MTNRPDIVANPLDEAAITCSNQDTSDASFHGSSVESVGLQSSYLPTCHFPSVETFGQNSNIVSRVTLEKVQTQASNQANRREPSFQSRDEASKSSRRWKARRLPFPSDSQGLFGVHVDVCGVFFTVRMKYFRMTLLIGESAAEL